MALDLRPVKAALLPNRRDTFGLLGYTPTAKQAVFHAAREYDVLYGGAAGGGKTKALVMEALRAADWYAGIRIGLFRRTMDELTENVIPELARVGFAEALGARWNGVSHELRFANGSLIRLRYLETLQDASRRLGGQYQLLLFDQLELFVPGAVEMLDDRLRTTLGSGVPLLGKRATANPGGASHGAVKKRYVDATDHGERLYADEAGQSVRFIPATVDDNPYVDPGYKARLEAIADPARRAALRYGSWESFSGQVFHEWNRERHVVPPWLLPASWARSCGIDYGYTAPWAVIWAAEDEDERLWVYRELYATGVGEHEQARRILEAEAEGRAMGADGEVAEPPSDRYCDPSMSAKRGDAESILTAYEREGCYAEPADNDRLAGLARWHTYLSEAPACLPHRRQGWTTCPRLHVFPACVNLIRSLPALPYSATRTEDVETRGTDDHLYDAGRYLLMSLGTGAAFHFPEDRAMPVAPDGSTPLRHDYGGFAVVDEDDLSPPYQPDWAR